MTVGPRFISRLRCLTALASTLTFGPLQAQQAAAPGQPITTAPADPAIAAALTQVSPDNIKAIITKLVSLQ